MDEWLKLCQYFALLTHQYCPDVHPPAAAKQKRNKSKGAAKGGKGGGSKQDVPAVERVLEVQLGDSAKRGKSGMHFSWFAHTANIAVPSSFVCV